MCIRDSDYASDRGNGDPWWYMNNGDPYSNANTYGSANPEDFVGYQFKLPASVTGINFWNRIYGDGGTFASTPRVELLRNGPLAQGGVWQEVLVTWNTPYDSTFLDGHRQYAITPTTPSGDVWGVRLIGAPTPGPAPDSGGWIGVGELQVTGDLPIASKIDLKNNLALGQTPLWSLNQFGRPQVLTDGNFTVDSFDTTWGAGAGNDYIGVLLDAAKDNITAIGVSLKTFGDGGWFNLDAMEVQYTTDGGLIWTDVTGLDLGRYPADLNYLINTAVWAEVAPFLWTFDAVDGVNGIRIFGPPGGGLSDVDGFIAATELEVFAQIPEPCTLALLALGCLMRICRRRR